MTERQISIHALREEGDPRLVKQAVRGVISIHALREEGDFGYQEAWAEYRIFLSTPSARRATVFGVLDALVESNFYPRPPRGGRPGSKTTAPSG